MLIREIAQEAQICDADAAPPALIGIVVVLSMCWQIIPDPMTERHDCGKSA